MFWGTVYRIESCAVGLSTLCVIFAYYRKFLSLQNSTTELSDTSNDVQTEALHDSSEMGKALSSNGMIQREPDDEHVTSPSRKNHHSSWLQHTQPKPVLCLSARLASDTSHEEDRHGRWTYWYPPLQEDNQIRRQWSGLRRVWSPPPIRSSDVLGRLHRPKPLRYRPYGGVSTTNWRCLRTGCFQWNDAVDMICIVTILAEIFRMSF